MTTANDEVPSYSLRGHRVPELDPSIIQHVAQRLCEILKLKKHSFSKGRIGHLINRLEESEIYVDVIEERNWFKGARATVDTQKNMIYMPEKLHYDLERSSPEAVRIFLHELGHIFLCHKALMHFSDSPAREAEDSEWQADYFADAIIAHLGLPTRSAQLELNFF